MIAENKEDAMIGEPMCVASVNMADVACPRGHTHIKDWSENEGILAFLVRAGRRGRGRRP